MSLKTYNRILIALTVALFALPILLDLVTGGWRRVMPYLAADAFYYLTVSRNFAQLGSFTYDGTHMTNGFHPLWQAAEGWLYRIALWLQMDVPAILVTVLVVNIVCISAAIVLLGRAFLTRFERLPLTFLIIPIGVYILIFSFFNRATHTVWSYANGMETGFVLLSYALLMLLMVQPQFLKSYRSAVLAGLVLIALFLSRLDHAFFCIAFFVVLGVQVMINRTRGQFKYLLVAGLVLGVGVGLYVAANYWTLGVLVPVSATMKSSFPRPLEDKWVILMRYLANRNPADYGAITSRTLPLVVPAIPAFLYLIWAGVKMVRRTLRSLDRALAVTALGVILLAVYNYAYVPLGDQGHWYFPVSTLFLTLLVIRFSVWAPAQAPAKMPYAALVEPLVLAGLLAGFFFWGFRSNNNSWYTDFMVDRAPEITQYYAGQDVKFVEYDDGIISYSLPYVAMSGMGFTLDPEGLKAKKAGKLLSLASERGYDRLASTNYFNGTGLTPASTSDEIKERLDKTFFLDMREMEPFTFSVEYVSPDKRFVTIRFVKK